MPIRAENRSRYPKEWPLISLWVRVCAGWRCCQRCHLNHDRPHHRAVRAANQRVAMATPDLMEAAHAQ